ncbi:MAG: hypothetical protein K2K17_07220 [Lachnospiraceae bacterium]|nr:hypothetical protein [Lachnospiraceae bacterium]
MDCLKDLSVLYYIEDKITEGGETMLCHLIIDLSKGLCTKSDDRTKLVQR